MLKKNTDFVIRRGWRVFYWCALCFIWVSFVAQTSFFYLAGHQDPYPITSCLILIILSIVVIAYRWAFNKMAAFDKDIQQLLLPSHEALSHDEPLGWYASEFRQIFDWRKSILFTVFFTVFALAIALNIKVGAWLPTVPTRILGAIPYILIGTAFGACVWPGYRMFIFIHHLATTLQRINPFAPTSAGIFIIGRTFMKFEAVGILLILLFGTAFEMSPYQLSNRLVLALSIIVSILWTFWFFFTQGKIHKLMVKYKHEKQDWFAEYYEKALTKVVRKPDRESFEELQRLIIIKKEIDSIPVWPFNARALVTSLGLIVSPIIAALMQRFIGK
jgi:hypothetical protein